MFAPAEYIDDQPSSNLCEQFTAHPGQIYRFRQKIRVPENAKNLYDTPFYDQAFMKKLGIFIKEMNKRNDGESHDIFLYIQDVTSRKMNVFCQDNNMLDAAANGIRKIAGAYSLDKMKRINPVQMAITAIHDAHNADEADLMEAYLGADDEMRPSQIRFNFSVAARDFKGDGERSYNKLREVFNKLNVRLVPSSHEHILNLLGDKKNIHIAFLVGSKASAKINKGELLSPAWFNYSLKTAMARIEGKEMRERLDAQAASRIERPFSLL